MLLSSITQSLKSVHRVENAIAQDDHTILIIPKKYPLGYREEKCQEPCNATFLLTHDLENYGEVRMKIVGSVDDPYMRYNIRLGYTSPQIVFKLTSNAPVQIGKKIEISNDPNSEFIRIYTQTVETLYIAYFSM